MNTAHGQQVFGPGPLPPGSSQQTPYVLKLFLLPQIVKDTSTVSITQEQWEHYSQFVTRYQDAILKKQSELFGANVNKFVDICTSLCNISSLDELNQIWARYAENQSVINQHMRIFLEDFQCSKMLQIGPEEFYPLTGVDEKSYKIGKIELQPQEMNIPSIPTFAIPQSLQFQNVNPTNTQEVTLIDERNISEMEVDNSTMVPKQNTNDNRQEHTPCNTNETNDHDTIECITGNISSVENQKESFRNVPSDETQKESLGNVSSVKTQKESSGNVSSDETHKESSGNVSSVETQKESSGNASSVETQKESSDNVASDKTQKEPFSTHQQDTTSVNEHLVDEMPTEIYGTDNENKSVLNEHADNDKINESVEENSQIMSKQDPQNIHFDGDSSKLDSLCEAKEVKIITSEVSIILREKSGDIAGNGDEETHTQNPKISEKGETFGNRTFANVVKEPTKSSNPEKKEENKNTPDVKAKTVVSNRFAVLQNVNNATEDDIKHHQSDVKQNKNKGTKPDVSPKPDDLKGSSFKKENKDKGNSLAGSITGEAHSRQLVRSATFRVFMPSKLNASEVMVYYKKSRQKDEEAMKVILTKRKDVCFWESKEVSIPVKDNVEYVYYYGFKKATSFLDNFKFSKIKEDVYEQKDRILPSGCVILDIFGTTDTWATGITKGDIGVGCWEYIKFVVCYPVEGDTKSNLILLSDSGVLSNFGRFYEYSLRDTVMSETEKLLKTKSDLQKQILVYVLAKCLPYYTFKEQRMTTVLQKECLETFRSADITHFPTGSSTVLKDIANSICTSHNGIANPFYVVTYFYDCLEFEQLKELISKPYRRETQDAVSIGQCFKTLFPALQKGEHKAVDVCYLLLEQIESHDVIMSISKTVSCVEKIDIMLRKQIMDKAFECSLKKVCKAIEACGPLKDNSLSVLGNIIQDIKDEDLQQKIKQTAEDKVLRIVSGKFVSWKESEVEILCSVIVPSFVFDEISFVKLLEEILKSHAENTRDLFLKLLQKSVCVNECITVLCMEWLKKAIDDSKRTYSAIREKRITKIYECLGDILAVEIVASDEHLSSDLEKVVRNEIETVNINLVMNAAAEVEKLKGKGHDIYLIHVQELLLRRRGKFKTGKLNDHLVSALGDGSTITLSLFSHLRLVETILDLSPLNCVINCEKTADDISVVLGILENLMFWNKIVTAKGYHANKVKDHIATRHVKKLMHSLVKNIGTERVTMQFAKKILDQIEKTGIKFVEEFLKNAKVFCKNTFKKLVENLQKTIDEITYNVTSISDMFIWLCRFDGICCAGNRKLVLHDLTVQQDEFSTLERDVSTNSKYYLSSLTSEIRLKEKWYLTESVAINDALNLESFHKYVVHMLHIDAHFIQKLGKIEIVVPVSNEVDTDLEIVSVEMDEETAVRGIDLLDDMTLSEESFIDVEKDTLDDFPALETPVVKEHTVAPGMKNTDMKVDASTFIEVITVSVLPRYKQFIEDSIWSISDVLVEDVQYLFCQCIVDQEIVNLGKFHGKDLPIESQKLIQYFRNKNDFALKASDIIRMCKVFGIDTSADSSSVGCCLKSMLKIHEDKSGTVQQLYSCMDEFDRLSQTLDSSLWEMIHELSKCQGLIEFLHAVRNEDLRNLIDAVEEHSEQFVQESTVSDLIQVKSSLYPLLINEKVTSEQLLDELKNIFNHATKATPQMINNCSQNCNSLKALYMNVANRGEVTKEIVAKIMEESTTEFNVRDDNVETKVMYMKGETIISYHLADLSDLRSRVLLISNTETTDQMPAGDKRGTLLDFVYICDLVVDIYLLLQSLSACGHFDFQHYNFITKQGNFLDVVNELEGLLEKLEKIHQEWKASLFVMREKFYYLNFIHSRQFHILNDFFKYGKRKEEAIAVMKYIKPNLRTSANDISTLAKSKVSHKTISEQLESLGQVLHKCIGTDTDVYDRFPGEEQFWKQIENVDARVYPGKVYVAHVDMKSIETVPILLSLYANTTKLLPLPNEVLFCNEDTTWEEIYLIIQRCTLRPSIYQNNLYCIVGAENLHYEIQYQLVQHLKALEHDRNENARPDFLLAFLCRSVSHDNFLTSLSTHVHKAPTMGNSAVKQCLMKVCTEVYMITSDLPGQGKTERIFNTASENLLGVVTVSISGPVSKETLVQHMNDHVVHSYQTLHLDIGSVDQPHIVDNFLFELIVLKCAVAGINCAHLNTQSVAIEVANTLNNSLRQSLYVGTSFQRIHIQWTNFREFVISLEAESAVQTVCKYLSAIEHGTYTKDIRITCDGTPVDQAECHRLLHNIFVAEAELSYSVVNVFLEVLADQLKRFSASHFFKVACLTAMLEDKNSVKMIRKTLLDALIKVSKEFSCRSISTCKTAQHAAIEQVKNLVKSETAAMLTRVEGMIRWSDSNHLLVLFQSQDSQTVSSLYREVSAVPPDVKKLIETQTRKSLPDLNQYSQHDLHKMLEKLACTSRNTDVAKRLGALYETYALTPDNILKMILVIMRIRTGIPVILMGETGCGKTTLVKYLANTCGVNLEVFQFHAGITKEVLISRILSWNKNAKQSKTAEYWVFLDEINTCDHLGLLKEIICHKVCDGQKLAPNLAVIAACNPYRNRDKNQVFTSGLQGKTLTDEFSQLVYRVHPLPEAMIDFVWDYGTLHKRDEVSYIERMVQNVTADEKFMKNIIHLLAYAQDFIRESERNSSSVSLRDVERCRTLIVRFCEFLQRKDKFPLKGENQDRSTQAYFRRAVLLSLSHCYEVRLTSAVQRKQFWEGIARRAYNKEGFGPTLMKFVHKEQMDILNRMVLPGGIAKNSALRENVFVLFVCILNRIPVFLVGKPGCSKSLSIQLLKSSLRGPDSDDDFLKTLPQLYIVSYQGSESSTSEGIIKVFEKAERYKKHNDTQDVLPVVLLDEVGLAEISQFNPLKVLHSLLEPATGEYPDVAVVGISNWALDAAKMNRAIHLSRPDLTVHELLDTGIAIKDGLDTKPQVPEEMLNSLARAYYEYQSKQPVKNFHGLRDYYSLVKYICGHYPLPTNRTALQLCQDVIQMGIERNFGGYKGSKCRFMEEFFKYSEGIFNAQKSISTETLIKANLADQHARHLMVITSGDYCLGIIANIIKEAGRSYEVIFGSQFEEDLSEEYSYRILSKIILCMEQGIVLILKDLEGIYGSLYDMLNQNYTVVGMKKNCRIALGAHSNPMCVVHEDFRCIVMVDTKRVDYSDPPFLNRFEKQILNFEDLLNDHEKTFVSTLHEWIKQFSNIKDKPFKPEDAFLAYHKETLPSLLHHVGTKALGITAEETLEYCKNLLRKTCPPDAILRLSYSDLATDHDEDIEFIQNDYFYEVSYESLQEYITTDLLNEDKENGRKVVLLTRSNINTHLEHLVGSLIQVQVERLGSFKSEKHLTQRITNFFQSDGTLLFMQCTPSLDSENMLLMKLMLETHFENHVQERKLNESKREKHVIVVVHINRQDDCGKLGWQIDYTNDWNIVTVDRLENNDFPIKSHVLGQTITDLLLSGFVPFEQIVNHSLIEAFSSMKYTTGGRSATSIWKAVDLIQRSSSLEKFLQETVIQHIQTTSTNYSKYGIENWQVKVANKTDVIFQGYPLVEAWKIELQSIAKNALIHVLWLLENTSSWFSFIECHNLNSLWLKNLWYNLYEKVKGELNHTVSKDNLLEIVLPPLSMKFPFSQSLVGEFLRVQTHFFNEEYTTDIESLDQIDPRDRSYITEKYSSMTEQIYEEHTDSLECDDIGLTLLEDDIYNILSFSPDIKIEEACRTELCKLFIQAKLVRFNMSNPHVKLSLILLTWVLQKKTVKGLLRLASACGQQIQQDILKSLKQPVSVIEEEKLLPVDDEEECCQEIEEVLVDKLCHQLIPTEETLHNIGRADKWFIKVSQLIAFASKVSYFPCLLQFLRLCIDVYTHLPDREMNIHVLSSLCSICTQSSSNNHSHKDNSSGDDLSDVAEELIDVAEELYLDSMNGLVEIERIAVDFMSMTTVENAQKVICLYFARCIDANPDTPRLPNICEKLRNRDIPDKSLTFSGPVVHRLINSMNLDDRCATFLSEEPEVENEDENNISLYLFEGLEALNDHPLCGLYIDIIENLIKEKMPVNEESLDKFEKASGYLQEATKVNLQYCLCLAYARLYLHWSVKFINENIGLLQTEKRSFLQRLDSTFSSSSASLCGLNTSLQVYFLKLLHNQSVDQLKEEVERLGEMMPSLQSIEWPTCEFYQGFGINALCLNDYYSDAIEYLANGKIDKIIATINKNKHTMQGMVGAVSQRYYWKLFIRPLSDEESLSNDVLRLVEKMDQPVQILMKCCLGIDQFQHKSLQVSTQWNYEDCIQGSFLLHVTTTLAQLMSVKGDMLQTVWVQMTNSKMKRILWEKVNTLLLSQTAEQNIVLAKCMCGHILMKEEDLCKCAQCENTDLDSEKDEVYIEIGKENIIRHILELCMNASIISSMALGLQKVGESDTEIQENFKLLWNTVESQLNLSKKNCCLFFSALLEETKTCSEVTEFLDKINVLLHDTEEKILHFKFRIFSVQKKEYDLSNTLEEVGEFRPIKENEGYFMHRMRKCPSIEGLKCKVRINIQSSKTLPFLRMIVTDEEKLEVMNCLPNILKWYLMLQKFVHHRVSRKEASNMKISDFIHESTNLKDIRRIAFDKFLGDWNNLRNSTFVADTIPGPALPEIYSGSPIDVCIVQDLQHPVYKVFDLLCHIQNEFLKNTAHIALNGCMAVAFLCNDLSVAVPYTLLHTSEEENIVKLEWSEDLLNYCQNSVLYGYGEWIQYDLEKVEREMADILLMGKCYLILDENFPITVFQHELFHRCSHVLIDIRKEVKQSPLPDHVSQRLKQCSSEQHGQQSLRALLNYLEIVISLVHKTKGKSFEKIENFSKKWGISDANIQSTAVRHILHQDVCLGNLVAMYEQVEEEIAHVCIDSLSNQYCEPLSSDLVKQVDKFVNDYIPVIPFMTAVKRFTVRYLSADVNYAKPHMHMSELMCHYSMWSSGVSESGSLADGKMIDEVFPTTLLAEHTRKLHDYLQHLAKKNEKDNKEVKSGRQQLRKLPSRKPKRKPLGRT